MKIVIDIKLITLSTKYSITTSPRAINTIIDEQSLILLTNSFIFILYSLLRAHNETCDFK